MDIGSSERLTMQNFQIPDTAETRIYTKVALSNPLLRQNRFTASRPDAVRVAPISAKTRTIKQQTSSEGGWVLRSGRGQLRETGSTSAIRRSTFPKQH
jgi:hypothetical protein